MGTWTNHDEALFTISRVSTLLSCVAEATMNDKVPKGTTIGEIGCALSLLYKELEEAHNTLYDEAK